MTSLALCQSIESRLESSLQGWRSRLDGLDQVAAVEAGQGGRAWSDDKIFKALLLAVLSNNTDWSKIERIQVDLADLFFGFSLKLYAELPACQIGNHILPWFLERKAGSVTLERDLVNLIGAVRLLFEHSCAHGNAESYITSLVQEFDGDPKQAALHLGSPGHYKLPAFGVVLAAEALKNLGFDVAKPDRQSSGRWLPSAWCLAQTGLTGTGERRLRFPPASRFWRLWGPFKTSQRLPGRMS